MFKFRKLFTLLALFLLLLAACREAPPSVTEPTTEPAVEPTAEEEMEEPTEEPAAEPTAEEEMAEVGPIRIGFMGPLTGGAAFIGQEQLGFVKAVAELYAAEHGLEIEVVEGDDEINPDVGKIVAEQFAADDTIVGVIGPAGSQVCEAVQPTFEAAGLVHITPSCTNTALTQPGTSTFFRPIPTDADQSKTIVNYMIETLGVTSVYLLDDQSSYSVGLNDEVEALLADAGVSTERASVTQDETDFSSIATAVVAGEYDAVLFPSQIESQEGTLAVQLREQGYGGVYFLADGGFSLGWVGAAGPAADGTYVTFFSPDPNLVPEAADMNAKYVELTETEEFGAFGGAAGFTAQILMEALVNCADAGAVTRECVLTEVAATNLETTVLGIPVSFGEGNQAAGTFSIFQVQDGAFNLLSSDEAGVVVEVEEPAAEATDEPLVYDGVIKVGFMGPLTGGAAFIGQEQAGFAQVTVDLFNERTGLNVELVQADDEINPDVGRIVAEQLAADEEILVVIGPAGSQVCEAVQPTFEAAGLAHITPSCTNTALTQPGTPTFFRPIPTDADQSKTIVNYMVDTLGVTSVYLLDDQSTYSVGLNDEVEALMTEAGVTVERASVTQEETDFSSIATAVVAGEYDAVLFPSQIENQEGTLAVQLREQGYEGIYFLADGGFSLGWVGTAGEAAEGTYVTFFAPDPNFVETMAPYNEAYAADFSEEFGAFGGAAQLATHVALDAIETCVRAGDVTRACVVDALTNINLETTPLGIPITFGEGNQAEGAFSLFQVQDGAFVLLEQ